MVPTVSIDLTGLTSNGPGNPFAAMWTLFIHGGWIPFIPVILWGAKELWLLHAQNIFFSKLRFVLLAIDVPKNSEQSPKAMEQVFAAMAGTQRKGNIYDRFFRGYVQIPMSFELVSLGGYVQYLARVQVEHRDLLESAVYSHYPDAEISEVPDYFPNIKAEFPGTHDLWGAEIAFVNKDPFPIRTYPLFEHQMTQVFLDPLAPMLEVMSRMKPDEQMLVQWIITPLGDDKWREPGIKIIKKLIGAKVASSGGPWIVEQPGKIVSGVYQTLLASLITFEEDTKKKNDKGLPSLMQHMPPHERAIVEAIGYKLAKVAFKVKARFIYLSTVPSHDKSRVSAFWGSLKQFAAPDLNSFKPDPKTKSQIDYWFTKPRLRARKRRIFWGYKYRSNWRGRRNLIMNIEELASIYHFPVMQVRAPLLKKTEAKRGEPPVSLPLAPPG